MRETLALFNEHFKNLKKNECILKTNFDSDLRKPFFLPKHRKKIGFPLALKKFFLAEGIVVSERRLFALEKREGVQKRKPTLKRKFPNHEPVDLKFEQIIFPHKTPSTFTSSYSATL